jgi:hypothetical protein
MMSYTSKHLHKKSERLLTFDIHYYIFLLLIIIFTSSSAPNQCKKPPYAFHSMNVKWITMKDHM